MNYILDNGNIFSYDSKIENKINKGSSASVYKLDDNKCIKLYFKDTYFKIEEGIFYLMKELDLKNFCKLDNMLYINNNLCGYTMNYYEYTKENILFKYTDYILDNFNILYNSFITLSNNNIIANDTRIGNTVVGDNNITIIDYDFYLKSNKNLELIKENNISKLLLIFNKLFYYSLKDIYNNISIDTEILLDDIFSYDTDIKKLTRTLNSYKKPIDFFCKKLNN